MADIESYEMFTPYQAKMYKYNEKHKHLWKPKNVPRDNQDIWNKKRDFLDMCIYVIKNITNKKDDEFYKKIYFMQVLTECSDEDYPDGYYLPRLYDAIEYGIKYLAEFNVNTFLQIPNDNKYEVALKCINVGFNGLNLDSPHPESLILCESGCKKRPFDTKKMEFVEQNTQDEHPKKWCIVS